MLKRAEQQTGTVQFCDVLDESTEWRHVKPGDESTEMVQQLSVETSNESTE